jgi:Multiubiquitin
MSTAHQAERADESAHHDTIIINGRNVVVSEDELTFDEVVALSGLATGPNITFTITYRRGHGEKPEGSLVENGDPVKVKDGMIFNVDPTTRS